MDKQTEMEVRAQSMITNLGAQRLEAMDRCVYLGADLAVAQAKIIELEDKLLKETTDAVPEVSPADGP